MKDYKRLTTKRENGFATVRNTTLQGLIDRLAELEDKIERGELDYVADSKTEQTITDLLIEFDEMGFVPTTLCPDIEKYAIEWREKVRAEIKRLENENAALRERLDKAVELPLKPSDFFIEPFFAEIKKDLLDENKIKVRVSTYAYFLFENEDKAELFVKGLQGENNEHI